MVDRSASAPGVANTRNLLAALGLGFALQSAVALILLWSLVWLPVYLFRNMYVLFLYPVVFVLWVGCMGLALIGLVLSLCAFGQSNVRAHGAGMAAAGAVISFFLLCTSWLAFVFGGTPLGSIGDL